MLSCSGLSTDIFMPQNAFDNIVDSFFEFHLKKHLKHVYIKTSTLRPDLNFYLKFQGFILVLYTLLLYLFSTLFVYLFITLLNLFILFFFSIFTFILFIHLVSLIYIAINLFCSELVFMFRLYILSHVYRLFCMFIM